MVERIPRLASSTFIPLLLLFVQRALQRRSHRHSGIPDGPELSSVPFEAITTDAACMYRNGAVWLLRFTRSLWAVPVHTELWS